MPNRYPNDWNARRRAVYRRDGWECRNCGRRGGPHGDLELHCHHIVPKARGGSHRLENLVTLCSGCHAATHNRFKKAPTAGEADAGSGWLTELYVAWQTFKRIRRLF